jgi:hypothetical protein
MIIIIDSKEWTGDDGRGIKIQRNGHDCQDMEVIEPGDIMDELGNQDKPKSREYPRWFGVRPT